MKRLSMKYQKILILSGFIILIIVNCKPEPSKSQLAELGQILFPGGIFAVSTGTGTSAGTATGSGTGTETQVSTPTFSPSGGVQTTGQNFTISTTTSGASIYYTIDGSAPTTSSTLYTASFHISTLAGKTVKAFATKSGLTDSSVASASYIVPLPKTGQTLCYDATTNVACTGSTGTDGETQTGLTRSYTGPTQHSIYTSDYTTTDNATGLVWNTCSQGLSGSTCAIGTIQTLTWANAASDPTWGCSALNTANGGNGYAGKTNWRIPTIYELAILVDYEQTPAPRINQTAFPNTQTGVPYWSDTSLSGTPASAWYTNFNAGQVGYNGKTNPYYVKCVSGSSSVGTSSFTDMGDQTIKDNLTGLYWQKCSIGQTQNATCTGGATTATWITSISSCSGLSLAGRSWRIPNINELLSINDYSINGPSISGTYFPNTNIGDTYWSSTTYVFNANNAWGIMFNAGGTSQPAKATPYSTRCVSGP